MNTLSSSKKSYKFTSASIVRKWRSNRPWWFRMKR